MKKIKIKTGLLTGLLAATILLFAPATAVAAGSATLSLSPSGGSYQVGSSITTTIYENSGSDAVNVVEAYLSYDASKLQFVSIGGGNFDGVVDNTGGGGSVHVTRYKGGGGTLSGSQAVASVTFKALTAGTASVSVVSGSHIVRASDQQDVWNGAASGASFTLTAVPETPTTPTPPSGGSSGGGTTTPTTTTTTVAGVTTTKSVSADGTTTTKVTKPDGTTTTTVVAADGTKKEETTDAAGSTLASETDKKTYLVGIKVLNGKGKPVANVKVILGGQTAKTDNTGVASFSGVTPGDYQATVGTGLSKAISTLTVKGLDDTKQPQIFEVHLKNTYKTYVIGGLGIIIVLDIIAFFVVKKKQGITFFKKR